MMQEVVTQAAQHIKVIDVHSRLFTSFVYLFLKEQHDKCVGTPSVGFKDDAPNLYTLLDI